jgi:hypothetical protein
MNGGISVLSLYVAAIAEEEEEDVALGPAAADGKNEMSADSSGDRPSSLSVASGLGPRVPSSVGGGRPSAPVVSSSKIRGARSFRIEGADSDDDDEDEGSGGNASNPIRRQNVEMIEL